MTRIIDMRSDTVTKPTEAMRKAMYEAEVGDDVLGEDPSVNRLQELGASMLGKEASLFVPSGTFANQCAIMTHCARGAELICAEDCHIIEHEAGGPAILSGVNLRPVRPRSRHLTWEEIRGRVRVGRDVHEPVTGLIALENALGNGSVIPLAVMKQIYEGAGTYGIPVHCDGARIFNAAFALGAEPREIARNADSVMFCLSKGLSAPVGSLLTGTKEFVAKAVYSRKIMGGGMRQAGILAAAGIVALKDMVRRLPEDHENAKKLSREFAGFDEITVAADRVDINMVFIRLKTGDGVTFVRELKNSGVLVYPPFGSPPSGGEIRFVTHAGITPKDIDYILSVTPKALASARG